MPKSVMNSNSNQPKAYDVVLGSQSSIPMSGAVLGGLPGVKRRLDNSRNSPHLIEQQINALKEALNYGRTGLSLVIEALNDKSWRIQKTAYSLLKNNQELIAIEALQEYNPYQFFQYLYRYSTGKSTTYAIAFTPNNQIMISGGNDRIITLRHLKTGKIIRRFNEHSGSIYSLCFSSDGQTLISGSRDTTIKIWHLHTIDTYKANSINRLIGDGLIDTLTGHSDSINAVAVTPNGQIIVSGSEDNTIKLWDLNSGKCLATLVGHEAGVRAVAISPDGQLLVSGSADHTIKLWQLPSVENEPICLDPIYTLTGHSDDVKCLAISNDGQILASGSQDKTIKLWNLETGELKTTLVEHWREVNHLIISPDGKNLISCSGDETIQVWQLETLKLLHSFVGHQDAVAVVAISPDGQPLISSSWDHTIRVWGMKD